jgi:amidase
MLRRFLVPAAFAALVLAFAGCLGSGGTAGVNKSSHGLGLAESPTCGGVVHGVDLLRASIPVFQDAMAKGLITSVELVDAYTARIDAFDNAGPKLNSVQAVNPMARTQAAALDAERAAGHVRGPLHGIPVLLKDNVGTNDQPTTAGSIALEKNVPPADATLTARLREAGAIILGKAHLSEFANWVSPNMPSGYSSLGGQVINAYTMGNPSGSSAGSGVAGSMSLASATIGTETSGSILSPSNLNSLVGVKPTLGLVSRAGVIPLAANFDTPGPMVRNVVDAALLLDAIAGPDPKDLATAASGSHLPAGGSYAAMLRADSLTGVRIGYQASTSPVFVKALDDLKRLGAVLVPLQSNQLTAASITEIPLIFNEFHYGINHYLATEAGPGLPVKDLNEIVLFNQQHPDKMKYGQEYIVASDATPGLGPPAMDAAALPTILASRVAADKLFSDNDVASIIGLNAPFTGLGAAAGYPTVTVPAGYNGKTPQGLSFFGPAWTEAKLLSFAFAYEQASHARQPPPLINPSLLDGVCGGPTSAAPATPAERADPAPADWTL